MIRVATPDAETVAFPRVPLPFRNVTVPDGMKDALPFTVAVSEKGTPYVIEPGEASRDVTEGAITSSMVIPDPHAG
jgi:hypothetical protein